MKTMQTMAVLAAALAAGAAKAATDAFCTTPAGVPALSNPVLFVTQVPIPADFATIGSVFANHEASMRQVGRGGDLYIRFPSGKLCNLTREGGFGVDTVFQGAGAIAVRDPAVHWSGTKALFSMVVGAPTERFEVAEYRWQLYEVTGLGDGETVTITPVPNQPAAYNNIMPAYGSDDRIFFASDRPRDGSAHLYPQLDEYESTPTNTGLWSLDPASGDLRLLQHAPSGSFDPTVDSYGRVIFTRWDHLERDQQADSDFVSPGTFGTFDYADETAGAARTEPAVDVFPEPRMVRTDLLQGTNLVGHGFNHFFPWMVHQDGSFEETLNGLGRHELHDFFDRSLNDDDNLEEFTDVASGRTNPNAVFNVLQLREDAAQAGRYVGVEAPEFTTHASGMLVALSAPPGMSADDMVVQYVTHPDTGTETDTPSADHSGHYRNPLAMADGTLLAVHTTETRVNGNEGTAENPIPRYDFAIKVLGDAGNGFLAATDAITGGISRSLRYFDPDLEVIYDGPLWELNPVEVVAATVPPLTTENALSAPEQAVFDAEGVDVNAFRQYLRDHNLGLMVARNVTSRDDADRQQPFNLRVPGGVQSIPVEGTVYDVTHLQFFEADQVRGLGGTTNPDPGRRGLARLLNDPEAVASNLLDGPPASVTIAADGSAAAFMPARRAMAWQTMAPDGVTPVVRERYWINFQPGEIRVCDSCHGVNALNQLGDPPPQNQPQALAELLQHWKMNLNILIFRDGFES